MSAQSILKYIQQSFAHWYPNDHGPYLYTLSTGDKQLHFSSQTKLSDKQKNYLTFAEQSSREWLGQSTKFRTNNFLSLYNEELLVHWLSQFSPRLQRERWLYALQNLRYRSYEHRSLRLNLIITNGQGSFDFLDNELQKVFDPLAGDSSVYFRVDQDFYFLAYEELDSCVKNCSQQGNLAPECMQPFLAQLGPEDIFLHYNSYGEILLASKDGLIARYRRGHWLLYEPQHLYPIFCSLFTDEPLGKNILDILFELSYRRRGALLIFDPFHNTLAHLANPEVINHANHTKEMSAAHQLLLPIIDRIKLKSPLAKERRKHLLLELAELDGAIIFDTEKVLAFGAMIEPHGIQSRCYGSRTLAALSAASRQAVACKVSCEGDIVIYFPETKHQTSMNELRIF